ncbi:MAG: hypothetical protein HZA51_05070 [Planctomycetes bacterium]|nr:hypothetical protein [Planctomycetota bacterium]
MAEQPKTGTGKGIALFLLFFVPIAGGLAATPFYLGMISTPDRQLDAAIESDVEAVHRAVLNLDEHLAALRQARDPADAPSDDVFNKKDLLKPYLPTLSATDTMLRNVDQNDVKQRGQKSIADKIPKTAPSPKAAYAEVMKLASAHDKILSEAEATATKLSSIERGGKRAGNHLWANRANAILQYSKAQIHRNRGEFESWRAALVRTAAEAQAPILLEMKRLGAAIENQKPTAALEGVSKRLEENETAAAAADTAVKKLTADIGKMEAQAKQLESSAADARAKIAELLASTKSPASYEGEVQALSQQARKAEAEWTALQNGTLEGATMKPSESVDPTVPTYEGGKPSRGIRDLKVDLATITDQASLLAEQKKSLLAEQEAFTKANEQFDAQKAEVDKGVESLSTAINGLLTEAQNHADAAKKAWDDSIKAYASAAKAAKSAITDAAKRTSDANAAKSNPPGQDDRLQRVSNDFDMEGSLHCLAAEIGVQIAIVNSARIDALQAEVATKNVLAAALGTEKVAIADDEVEKLRTDALAQVAEAIKSYDKASALISKTSVKAGDTTISGKNYVWQVQVAQAAANLMQASLNADKPEDAAAAREKAYKLLTAAVDKKDQSALLGPAVDAIVHLQKTAR